MAFSHRTATLAAVVAIPLGIAATSYALTDEPGAPKPPAKVELERPGPSHTPRGEPSGTPGTPGAPGPSGTSGDQVVPRPSATNDRLDDSDDGEDGDGDGDGDD